MKHEPGILEFWCYVCKGRIAENPVSIGGEVFRHKRCKMGSKKWLESEIKQKHPFRNDWIKKQSDSSQGG
jgi:hypothetical protein